MVHNLESSDAGSSSSGGESDRGGIATDNVAVGTGVSNEVEVLGCFFSDCTRASDKAESFKWHKCDL